MRRSTIALAILVIGYTTAFAECRKGEYDVHGLDCLYDSQGNLRPPRGEHRNGGTQIIVMPSPYGAPSQITVNEGRRRAQDDRDRQDDRQ